MATTTTTLPAAQSTATIARAFTNSLDVRETTRATYTRALQAFLDWVNTTGRALDSLDAADIIAYKQCLLSVRSTATTAISIAAIHRLYNWVEDNGGKNIARKVRAPRIRKTFTRQHLTPAESRAVVAAARNRRDKAIITLMLATGLREVEITRLNIGSIKVRHIVNEQGEEVTRRVLQVWGKGRDAADAFVVIPTAAWTALLDYLATRPLTAVNAPLFTANSTNNRGGRLSTRAIRAIVGPALKKAGLTGVEYSTHSLRHTAAVAALRNGASVMAVQGMLRHASPATTQIYLDSIRGELRLTNAAEDAAASYLRI